MPIAFLTLMHLSAVIIPHHNLLNIFLKQEHTSNQSWIPLLLEANALFNPDLKIPR